MATPHLEMTELADGQVDQYLTANTNIRILEQAIAGRLSINFASDANLTLSTTAGSEEWFDTFLTFTDTSSPQVLTAGRDVVFPAKDGPVYYVLNSTAQTLTLKISGQTGVAVAAGEFIRVYYDGSDIAAWEPSSLTLAGDLLVNGDGKLLGYTTGSGGTVTQITSRTTGVTLNKSNGAITLVSAAGSTAWQTFTVTNSVVSATDTVIVNQKSGTDLYQIHVTAVGAGSFNVTFATTGGTTTEQPVFNFAVIKGVAA